MPSLYQLLIRVYTDDPRLAPWATILRHSVARAHLAARQSADVVRETWTRAESIGQWFAAADNLEPHQSARYYWL